MDGISRGHFFQKLQKKSSIAFYALVNILIINKETSSNVKQVWINQHDTNFQIWSSKNTRNFPRQTPWLPQNHKTKLPTCLARCCWRQLPPKRGWMLLGNKQSRWESCRGGIECFWMIREVYSIVRRGEEEDREQYNKMLLYKQHGRRWICLKRIAGDIYFISLSYIILIGDHTIGENGKLRKSNERLFHFY